MAATHVREPPEKRRRIDAEIDKGKQQQQLATPQYFTCENTVRETVFRWWCGLGSRLVSRWDATALGFVDRESMPPYYIVEFPLHRTRWLARATARVIVVNYQEKTRLLTIYGVTKKMMSPLRCGMSISAKDLAMPAKRADAYRLLFPASPDGNFVDKKLASLSAVPCVPTHALDGFTAASKLAESITRKYVPIKEEEEKGGTRCRPVLGRSDPLRCRTVDEEDVSRNLHREVDDGVSKFVTQTAFMVAASAVHGSSAVRAACGLGYAMLCESLCDARDDAASEHQAFAAAVLNRRGTKEVYQYDSQSKAFFATFGPADNNIVPSGRQLWSVLRQTLRSSSIRNARHGIESMVFAVTAARGLLRELVPCERCRRTLPPAERCQHLCVACLDGVAFVTASDLYETRFITSMKTFERATLKFAFASNATGLASFARLARDLDDNETAPRKTWWNPQSLAKTVVEPLCAKREHGVSKAAFARAVERDATEMAVDATSAAHDLQHILGVVDVEMLVTSREFGDFLVEFARTMFSVRRGPYAQLLALYDADAKTPALIKTASSQPDVGLRLDYLSGYSELAAAGWSVAALRRWLPPCLGIIVDECTRSRHPQYPERMIFGSFLSRISGLLADQPAFYATWSQLFAHPEPSCTLSKNPSSFARSKYGTRAVDDIKERFDKKCFFECAFAIRNGVCPLAFDKTEAEATGKRTLVQSEVYRLGREGADIEDAVTRVVCLNTDAITTPDAIPRVRCLEFLRRCFGVSAPQKVMVNSPSWFYHAAAKKA